MPNIHRVANYGGISFYDALQLPCDMFQAMLRQSVIEELMKTEDGREYLKKCERLKNTEMDDNVGDFIRGELNGKQS